MKIKKVYAGSWVPRTALHLEEFFQFLSSGKSSLSLDEQKLLKLRKELRISNLYRSDDGTEISARLDKLDFSYQENGLIIFGKKVENLDQDTKYLGDFSINKLFPAFSYIYSLGAPIPKIFTAIFSVLPFIISVESGNEKEIKEIFNQAKKKINKVISDGRAKIYFSAELVVIDTKKEDKNLIKNLIFIEDCRGQFSKILNLHRFIWGQIDKIVSVSRVPHKNLAVTRDSLLELDNELIFLSSRLQQIVYLLEDLRNSEERSSFKNYLRVSLASLTRTGAYLKDLWSMTENKVKSAQSLISSLYQESTKKQLNILQVIFIVSAMASIIALGSVYGFEFKAYDVAGEMVFYGDTKSFTFFDLARFGSSALVAGFLIYTAFFFVYNKISYSKITSIGSLRQKELEAIKKMFR